jgi:hypothetical protein
MKILIISMMCWAFWVPALGQIQHLSVPPLGSVGESLPLGNDAHKTRSQHETTTKGCLIGQNGKYILITSNQSGVLQLVATPNLEAHVGHKVKITGNVEDVPVPQPAVTSSPAETDEAPASTPTDISTTSQLRARKIKTISAVCESKPDKASKKSWIRILSL